MSRGILFKLLVKKTNNEHKKRLTTEGTPPLAGQAEQAQRTQRGNWKERNDKRLQHLVA